MRDSEGEEKGWARSGADSARKILRDRFSEGAILDRFCEGFKGRDSVRDSKGEIL